ncbi:Dimethyladenosine transferase 2, mitochondrial [Amphibalanus amphitrite]|uniref:rRNA adenine N(6)-methyltransferase n=1 Tax=Amphibalanus amphitrite TaxID=1232801 RepID=A0A6A4VPQ6_AMPAM|nr:Dimethyladenosine transferase 2, mitochondrial [Amphibalanus amphitrite]
MHHLFRLIRLPRETSYCVALTFRRLCSTQDNVEPKKPKQAQKGTAKSKQHQPLEGEGDVINEPKKLKGEGKKKTQAELLAEHVAQEPAAVQKLLQQFDAQLNKSKPNPETFYIINESIADSVVRHLSGHSLDIPHLELGPGPGVLTRRLLEAGVRRIVGFETTSAFQHCVRMLSEQTDGAVRLTPLNLMHLSKFYGASAHGDDSRVLKVVDGLEHRDWTDEPCMRLVGVAHRSVFFQFLVRTVISRELLFQFGRPELLVYVPEAEYARLTAGPTMAGRVYRPYSIISRMLFDLEELDRVPAKHFYPWVKPRRKVEASGSDMVLIRYAPKADPGVPEAELHNLDFFVRHCAVSRTRRIIQQMEEWVPGCGPRLIALGHGVFAPFRELQPQQVLEVFLEFTKWPEYPACSFHAAVQQNVLGGEPELADSEHQLAEDDQHEEPPEHFEPQQYR